METSKLIAAFQNVRKNSPLVHSITNYVTVNDCANVLLAIGASPIMSDEVKDVSDITSICGGLVLNIGTLNERTIESMFVAGRRAAELNHPIVLDPVGAGASALRTQTACALLDELPIAVIRGNMSEIKALVEGATTTCGVDVCPADVVTEENLAEAAQFARECAQKTQSIVAITGAIDIVADAQCAYAVRNGSPLMGRITGAGCMLTCVTAAYAVANQNELLPAIVAAVCSMGCAGEIAQERMTECDGNATYRNFLIDALFALTDNTFRQRARVSLLN